VYKRGAKKTMLRKLVAIDEPARLWMRAIDCACKNT
jgi:hypothetical protein